MRPRYARVPLGSADTAGGILAWRNPHPVPIIVDQLIIETTVIATASCTADFGVAANGTTSNDSLIDGLDLNAALVTADNITDKGSNGKSRQKVAVGSYVTGSKASGAAAGLAGYAHIRYFRTR